MPDGAISSYLQFSALSAHRIRKFSGRFHSIDPNLSLMLRTSPSDSTKRFPGARRFVQNEEVCQSSDEFTMGKRRQFSAYFREVIEIDLGEDKAGTIRSLRQ